MNLGERLRNYLASSDTPHIQEALTAGFELSFGGLRQRSETQKHIHPPTPNSTHNLDSGDTLPEALNAAANSNAEETDPHPLTAEIDHFIVEDSPQN